MNARQSSPKLARSGFTIIELMVVILIILALAALLLPAIMGAWTTVGTARQVDDMNKLQSALEQFKNKFGIYPPSRIRLREGTAYNTNEGFDAHSLKMLKLIWPSLNPVTVNGTAGDPNTAAVAAARRYLWCCDRANKVGDPTQWTDTYELEGDECLVFFLGGIAQFDRTDPTSAIILHGFTKRANDPTGIPNANIPATLTRETGLMDFTAARLIVRRGEDQIQAPPSGAINATSETNQAFLGNAFPNATITRYLNTDTNTTLKLPSYLALGPSAREDQRPWMYFSAYDNNGAYGYRPDDCNLPWASPPNVNGTGASGFGWFESVDPSNVSVVDRGARQRFQFHCLAPRTSGSNTNHVNTVSGFPNPCTESFPYGQPDAGTTLTQGTKSRWYNPNRFQLISPGADGKYGPGGQIPRVSVGTDAAPDITYTDLATSGGSFDNVSNVSGSQRLGEFNETQKK